MEERVSTETLRGECAGSVSKKARRPAWLGSREKTEMDEMLRGAELTCWCLSCIQPGKPSHNQRTHRSNAGLTQVTEVILADT